MEISSKLWTDSNVSDCLFACIIKAWLLDSEIPWSLFLTSVMCNIVNFSESVTYIFRIIITNYVKYMNRTALCSSRDM